MTVKMDAAIELIKRQQSKIDEIEQLVIEYERKRLEIVALNANSARLSAAALESHNHSNNFVDQCHMEKDIFLSGFSDAPDISRVAAGLSALFHFPIQEIKYKYGYEHINLKANTVKYCVIIGLENVATKNRILDRKTATGTLYLSDIVGPAANYDDPPIIISNRLTAHNMQLKKELLNPMQNWSIYRIVYCNCRFLIIPSEYDTPIIIRTFADFANYKNF